MGYYNDYAEEPIGGGNPYQRCVHCKLSSPAINGRIEGHEDYCFYRLVKERGLPYEFTPFDRAEEAEGPTAEDGSYEEGFRGPRPWNNYDDSEERAAAVADAEFRAAFRRVLDYHTGEAQRSLGGDSGQGKSSDGS